MTDTRTEMEIVMSRLSSLESHIINLIIPIQNISRALTDPRYVNDIRKTADFIINNPVKLDDAELRRECRELKALLREFTENKQAVDLNQTLAEIKYIGKRVMQIEQCLARIDASGIKNDVTISVVHNGIRPKDSEDEYYNSVDISLENICNSLPMRGSVYLRHYIEGAGTATQSSIAKKMGITSERVGQIKKKVKRVLSSPFLLPDINKMKDAKTKEILSMLIK